jgi:hypothetical protein
MAGFFSDSDLNQRCSGMLPEGLGGIGMGLGPGGTALKQVIGETFPSGQKFDYCFCSSKFWFKTFSSRQLVIICVSVTTSLRTSATTATSNLEL